MIEDANETCILNFRCSGASMRVQYAVTYLFFNGTTLQWNYTLRYVRRARNNKAGFNARKVQFSMKKMQLHVALEKIGRQVPFSYSIFCSDNPGSAAIEKGDAAWPSFDDIPAEFCEVYVSRTIFFQQSHAPRNRLNYLAYTDESPRARVPLTTFFFFFRNLTTTVLCNAVLFFVIYIPYILPRDLAICTSNIRNIVLLETIRRAYQQRDAVVPICKYNFPGECIFNELNDKNSEVRFRRRTNTADEILISTNFFMDVKNGLVSYFDTMLITILIVVYRFIIIDMMVE